MLARPHRLKLGNDYRLVVRRGDRCGGARLITSMLTTREQGPPRFGFIVSKQVGTAVVRNTIRRRLKAICNSLRADLPSGTDVVIRALPAAATATSTELRHDLVRCLDRLNSRAVRTTSVGDG